jgi:tetratricopeptide (TPR) repeat protein
MHTKLKTLAFLCASMMLAACADLGQRLPFLSPSHASAGADALYAKARAAHLAGRQQAALAGYEETLRMDPAHVDARNGMAALYAEQGAFDKAIPLWEALTASGASRDSAYLYSNLGYALLLHGDYDRALAALQEACLLDPLNHRAWRHMGATLDKLGQHERAKNMVHQADLLQQHDMRADVASAPAPVAPAIAQAVQANDGWATTEVVQSADGMFELRRAAQPSAARKAEAPPAASLEIRNGNGVKGMAKSLSRQMDGHAVRVVRLSNEKGFGVLQTRVEYRAPYRAAAEQLAVRFGNARLQETTAAKSADMRLVIGRDLIPAHVARDATVAPAAVSFVSRQTTGERPRDNGSDHHNSGASS